MIEAFTNVENHRGTLEHARLTPPQRKNADCTYIFNMSAINILRDLLDGDFLSSSFSTVAGLLHALSIDISAEKSSYRFSASDEQVH